MSNENTVAYILSPISFKIKDDNYQLIDISFSMLQLRDVQIFYNRGFGHILKKNGEMMKTSELTEQIAATMESYNFEPRQ